MRDANRVDPRTRCQVATNAVPTRTLFLSHDSSLLYGAQRSLYELLTALDRRQLQPFLVTPNEGDLPGQSRAIGIPTAVLPLTRWVVPASTWRDARGRYWRDAFLKLRRRVETLVSFIENNAIDIVYSNTVTRIDGALAARFARKPHIWHLREHITGNRNLRPLLPEWMCQRAIGLLSKRVIVNSNALAAAYDHPCLRNKLAIVHNGVDVRTFFPQPDARERFVLDLGLRAETRLIAIVASIEPQKRHLLFAEAAALVKQRIPCAAFIVIGDGDPTLVQQLRSRVAGLGLQGDFHFLGWQDDLPSLLPAMDILVSTADQEAFGRTLIEAMASGVAVVATRSGGPEEIVLHGETGFLVPREDPTALAAAIVEVAANPGLARRFGDAGRLRATEFFSLASYAQKVQAVISECAVLA